ncbi:MAG: LysR family transcriptional regulator [Acidobacteria bacterium]|nr:LysR family transcriptional regulator [Acidobacteriota bacterium]
MNLDQLVSFRTVARMGSFRRAAEALHLTQPAVSKQIQALEAELGERLLERGRTARLTVAGEVLLKYAERVPELVQAARDEISDLRELGRGHLSLGAAQSIAIHLLPRLLEAYRARYPRVTLAVEAGVAHGIMRRVIARELDLGLVVLTAPGPDPPAELTCVPLGASDVVFVAPASEPLVKRRRLTLTDLGNLSWIVSPAGCQYRGYLERRFTERGLQMNVAVEVTGLEVQRTLVRLGLGVTLLPEPLVAHELQAGTLKAFSVEGTKLRSLSCLLYRRDKYIHGAMKGFLALLREVCPPGKASRGGTADVWYPQDSALERAAGRQGRTPGKR